MLSFSSFLDRLCNVTVTISYHYIDHLHLTRPVRNFPFIVAVGCSSSRNPLLQFRPMLKRYFRWADLHIIRFV